MKKILYFVTEDWYFCSHRLPLAIAAKKAGYQIAVVTRVGQHADDIQKAGIDLIPVQLSRGSINPVTESLTIWQIYRILRREKPDLLHNVAIKPVLYGTIAARLSGTSHVVNALTGLGHLFTDTHRSNVLRPFVRYLFRFLLTQCKVIVQNPDDLHQLVAGSGLPLENTVLIRGSGVDINQFFPIPEPEGTPIVVLAARMLWDKGVMQFKEAAELLHRVGIAARFVLVGDTDKENLSAIPRSQLEEWNASGMLEWWGQRTDMPHVFQNCHIVCLPSYYGEGVPKTLLEAAATGKPIVTTDSPGCREVVHNGRNGLLVPVRDAVALANALKILIENPELRKCMGQQGRARAETEFAIEYVIEKTLAIYEKLLKKSK